MSRDALPGVGPRFHASRRHHGPRADHPTGPVPPEIEVQWDRAHGPMTREERAYFEGAVVRDPRDERG